LSASGRDIDEWDEEQSFVVAEAAICSKHKKFHKKCYEEEDGRSISEGIEIIEWT
jgi:hypothetical protein